MTKRSAVRGELIAYASFGNRMTHCMRQFSADGRAKGGKMKRYELLRLAIRTRAYTMETFGEFVLGGMAKSSLSNRLTGHTSWTISEAYAVLDGLRFPHEWMSMLFPPNGIAKVTDEQREMIRFGRTHDGFKSSVC